jgi:hypothetical protein
MQKNNKKYSYPADFNENFWSNLWKKILNFHGHFDFLFRVNKIFWLEGKTQSTLP